MVPIEIRQKLDDAIAAIASDLPPGSTIAVLIHHSFESTPPGYQMRWRINEPEAERLRIMAGIAEIN